MKVLLTDLESRKGFDTYNIIKHIGYEVVATAPKDRKIQLPLVYIRKIHPLSDLDFSSFERDLNVLIEKFRDLLYIPVSEKYTILFYQFIDKHPDAPLKHLLPSQESFFLCREKDHFQSFCEKNEFPVPGSWNAQTIKNLSDDFRPLVAKKKIGAGSVGLKFIHQAEDLKVLDTLNLEEYLIQDFIDSTDGIHGGFYCCDKGKVVAFHGHKRLRTFPESGGVTVFSKAENIPEIEQIGKQVLEALDWNGVAMIEFMYDKHSHSWKIIELNPRLWGSIMLSYFSGSGIIENYLSLALGKGIVEADQKKESYIHWIFPFDIMNLLKRKIKLSDLLNRGKRVCYINFSYSNPWSAFTYLIYFTFNFSSIKRFIKKITG